MTAPARSQSPMNSASARRQSASGARAPEAANAADAESRVRSEKSRTETTTAPAVDANLPLDDVVTWANAAAIFAETPACHDQSVRRMVSNVLHELAIDRIAGPAAR